MFVHVVKSFCQWTPFRSYFLNLTNIKTFYSNIRMKPYSPFSYILFSNVPSRLSTSTVALSTTFCSSSVEMRGILRTRGGCWGLSRWPTPLKNTCRRTRGIPKWEELGLGVGLQTPQRKEIAKIALKVSCLEEKRGFHF